MDGLMRSQQIEDRKSRITGAGTHFTSAFFFLLPVWHGLAFAVKYIFLTQPAEARISAFVSVRRDKAGVTKKGIVPETEVREKIQARQTAERYFH